MNSCQVDGIYTVRSVFRRRGQSEDVILVEELINPIWRDGMECGFFARRFRPVVERKTDISFAHEILRKASKPARGPVVASPHGATNDR
jgi:hypothetical protein